MVKKYAPIALFVYNRPIHSLNVIEALKENPESKHSDLYIFSDGMVNENKPEIEVIEVRKLIQKTAGFKQVKIIENIQNAGLAKSIIGGINQVLADYASVIVLEDDIVVSKKFLHYMNWALNNYEKELKVGAIQGFQLPVKFGSNQQTFFDSSVGCWGWATWKNRWELFEENGQLLWNQIQQLNTWKDFNIGNTISMQQMLLDQINGKNNSWAIRWYASLYLQQRLCLYPTLSLTNNIGNDGSGVHGSKSEINSTLWDGTYDWVKQEIKIDETKRRKIIQYRKQILLQLKIRNRIIKFRKNILKLKT